MVVTLIILMGIEETIREAICECVRDQKINKIEAPIPTIPADTRVFFGKKTTKNGAHASTATTKESTLGIFHLQKRRMMRTAEPPMNYTASSPITAEVT